MVLPISGVDLATRLPFFLFLTGKIALNIIRTIPCITSIVFNVGLRTVDLSAHSPFSLFESN